VKKEINKVVQKDNAAEGDLVGRDKNVTNILVQGQISALRRRSQELKELYSNDEGYRGFIEKLQKYLTYAESNRAVRSLEEKLTAGQRADLVGEAKVLKEQFAKKISRHQFSDQAQELFSHILAQIHSFFNSKVRPLIAAKTDNVVIDALIYDELIKKIYDEVGDGTLNIDMQEIRGMLFYLTGNCHLEWD
jgi:hypothetical protein